MATSLFHLQADKTTLFFNASTAAIEPNRTSQPKRGRVCTLPPQDRARTWRQRGKRLSWFPSPSSQQLPPMSSRCGTGCASARGGALEGEGGGGRSCCFYLLRFVCEKRISTWLPTICSGKGTPPGTLQPPSRRVDMARLPPVPSPPARAAETQQRPLITGEAAARAHPSLSQRVHVGMWPSSQERCKESKARSAQPPPRGSSSSARGGPAGSAFGPPQRLEHPVSHILTGVQSPALL